MLHVVSCLFQILDSLDDHYVEESVLFMGVLNELTKAVVRWFPEENKQTGDNLCTCKRKKKCECDVHIKNTQAAKNCPGELHNVSGTTNSLVEIDKDENHDLRALGNCIDNESVGIRSVSGNCKCNSSHADGKGIHGKKCACNLTAHDRKDYTDRSAKTRAVESADKNVGDRNKRKSAQEVKQYFSNLLKLESEARGEFTEEDLDMSR